MTLPPRRPAAELMDRVDADPIALEHALRDLRWVNRWLGGRRAALHATLKALGDLPAAGRRGRSPTILDVGTGSADIPVALLAEARRSGMRPRLVATDLHPRTVAAARTHTADEPAIDVSSADALDLPFDDDTFDVAMCHTALHHFSDEGAARLLAELRRVAMGAVVVTDLYRSRISIRAVETMAMTLWRGHAITRHDSVTSIRAAFTPSEALQLARKAGLRQPHVTRHPFFRFALVDLTTARDG